MHNSYFNGMLSGLILNRLVAIILTVMTAGLCYPFALVMMKKWEIKHTIYRRKKT